MQQRICIENVQKEPVFWRNGDRLDAKNLALAIELQVEHETKTFFKDCNEPISKLGVTFGELNDATIFEAQPSVAFSSSAMLSRMLTQIKEYESDTVGCTGTAQSSCGNRTAKSILKLDEMLNCVVLHRLNEPKSFICQLCVHPSDKSRESLSVLQNLLTYCMSQTAKSKKLYLSLQEIEKNISSLRLYSFAWLCSVVQTLGLHPLAERLEEVFRFNLKRYLQKVDAEKRIIADDSATKDFYYVLMFFCSIAVRRADPMQRILKFLYKKKYIAMYRNCYQLFEQQFLLFNTVATSNVALQILESLQFYFKDQEIREKKTDERLKTNDALTLVQVFVSWLNKTISKTTAKQREALLRCTVCFDRCYCDIVCDSDTLHRKFIVKKKDYSSKVRCCRMSFTDLCEWLRYMVLLQLDARNVHGETKFYIHASPELYKFSPAPSLQFHAPGIDFLSFFLLESEFVRASLYQKRPELREMREEMACDSRLRKFICTKEPYDQYIILSQKLLKVAVERYRLKTIQAVAQAQNIFASDK